MALGISIVVFLLITVVVIAFGYRRYVVAGRVYESLGGEAQLPISFAEPDRGSPFISRAAEFVGTKLPPSAQRASALQKRLLAAGYRDARITTLVYGLKLLLMAGIGLVMLLLAAGSDSSLFFRAFTVLIGIFAGFKLPDFVLSRRIARRAHRLRRGLPDALDLFVVCAEAGLTIDRCFRTVTTQLDLVHPELCSEFSLFTAEIGAGLRRKEALENLALRTQEPETQKFTQVLIQADRFGTSIADALRTHAEYLRVKRRQDAEEAAAKIGVKLIFPIFFFILPCMVLVTVGPAAVQIRAPAGEHVHGLGTTLMAEPESRFIDYYELLQISPKAQPETIQRVFRIFAGRYHPDNPNTGDVERFLRLSEAYEVLNDPERRAVYDDEYSVQKTLPIEIFNLEEFATGIDGEANRRMGLLCLLYHQRRINPEEPGLSLLHLENMMVSAREHLLFTVWYLKDKSYIRQTEESNFAITSSGVDFVEENLPKNRLLYRLLKEAEDGSARFAPESLLVGNEAQPASS